jgi:hypothetical protein
MRMPEESQIQLFNRVMLGRSSAPPKYNPFDLLGPRIKRLWLAFCAEPGKLPFMNFTSYWWRFTYRTNNPQRGAFV